MGTQTAPAAAVCADFSSEAQGPGTPQNSLPGIGESFELDLGQQAIQSFCGLPLLALQQVCVHVHGEGRGGVTQSA